MDTHRVYFLYVAANTVVYIDETEAFSSGEACSNIRFLRFGRQPKQKILESKGIEIVSAIKGSEHDEYLWALAHGQEPPKPQKKEVKVVTIKIQDNSPHQDCLPGLEVVNNAQLL